GVVDIDQVTVASLPVIQFQGLNTFVLDPGAGSDSATFITASLGGALPSNYRVNPDVTDTVTIEGTAGAASFTGTPPALAVPGSVKDNVSGVTVSATSGPARVQLNLMTGVNLVTVDVSNTDVIGVPLSIDGGGNLNGGLGRLTVTGTPALSVASVTYTPGTTFQ